MRAHRLLAAGCLAICLWVPAAWAQTQAGFTADPSSGSAPLLVQFHNLSSPDSHTWIWSFGDGGSSTLFEPSHTYALPGSYPVNLLVFGEGSDLANQVLHVQAPVLDPGFEVAPSAGTVPLEVGFEHTSDDDAVGWLWDFGDGTTSSELAPTHVYWVAGAYDVTLTVSAAGSSASGTQPGVVQAMAPEVMMPAMEVTPVVGLAPLEAQFRYTGHGAEPETFLWDFGDGTTSTERDPEHTFTEPGPRDVSLVTTLAGVVEGVLESAVVSVGVAAVDFGPMVTTGGPALYELDGAADVSGDGLLDVVSVQQDIVVFPGVGDGTLAAPVVTSVPGSEVAGGVADLGDLDGDALTDVVTLTENDPSGHRLTPWLASGGGALAPGEVFPVNWTQPGTTRIVLGDVRGDGRLDLVATHGLLLTVLDGDGQGGFLQTGPPQATVLSQKGKHTGLTLRDLDLDGDLDLHARYKAYSGFHWVAYENSGVGRFEASCSGSGGSHSELGSSHLGDLDGDGIPEIVTAWNVDYCSLSNAPPGSLPVDITSWATGCPGSGLCTDTITLTPGEHLAGLGDLDGLAGEDLLVHSPAAGLSVRPSTGSLAFGASLSLPDLPTPRLVADLDGDGLGDLVGLLPGGGVWTARNQTPVSGWVDVGGGLPGKAGTPQLQGSGLAAPGALVELALSGAAPGAPAWLVVGLEAPMAPFLGGILVPSPEVILAFTTGLDGEVLLQGSWPGVLGPGATTWWQVWIADAVAAAGAAASNGVRHVVPGRDV